MVVGVLGCSFMASESRSSYVSMVLSVISYNVLAAAFTHHNARFHGSDGRETIEQTQERYAMASSLIISQRCDVIFLQECDDYFLQCSALFGRYVRHDDGLQVPGTCVLVSRVLELAFPVSSRSVVLGAKDDIRTHCHMATLVFLEGPSGRVCMGSLHVRSLKNRLARPNVEQLVSKVGDVMTEEKCSAILLGGDWNCIPGHNLDELTRSYLPGLKRFPNDKPTGLTANFDKAVCIDHFFSWNVVMVAMACECATIGSPQSPWNSDGHVVAPSDHVPIRVVCRCCGIPEPNRFRV